MRLTTSDAAPRPVGQAKRGVARSIPAASAEPPNESLVAGVSITHPDRVIFSEPRITKLELARHYERAAPWLLPFIARRPLSLVRCPKGTEPIDAKRRCFVQKHFPGALPDGVRRVGRADAERLIYVEDVEGIVSLVQLGVIEFHTWGSRIDDLERPDYLVLDLDPGPGVAWDAVREAAGVVRTLLRGAGLDSVVRTTGGKGLHVVAHLPMRMTWADAKNLAKSVAERAVADAPDTFVATASKSKRIGRIFIDSLRNARGATAIASYSVRARIGAPLAMPIGWRDLGKIDSGAHFSITSLGPRILPLALEWQAALARPSPSPPKSKGKPAGKPTRKRA